MTRLKVNRPGSWGQRDEAHAEEAGAAAGPPDTENQTDDGAGTFEDSAAAGTDGTGGGLEAEIAKLRSRLQEKELELQESNDRYLRSLADTQNIRKRVQQERDEAIEYANVELIKQWLPILDNFDRAIKHSETSQDFNGLLEGVRKISKQMHDTLKKIGVETIEAVGQPFDPEQHEAIGHAPSDEHAEGSVAEEVASGYRLKGRLIRPSLVRVAGG